MKKRKYFELASILASIVLFCFFFLNKKEPSVKKEKNESYLPSASIAFSQASQVTPPPSGPTQYLRMLAAYQIPITFYGKVIDQHRQPVTQANVKFFAYDNPGGNVSTYTRVTNDSGLFSIDGIKGTALAVKTSKEGFLQVSSSDSRVASSNQFDYYAPPESNKGVYRPDINNPSIFMLHKIEATESLVKIGKKKFRIRRDGIPLIIPLDVQNSHQITLRCWTKDLGRSQGQNKYDWNFEINVSSGGLLIRKDALAFDAPTEGYLPTDTINMPSTLPFGAGGWDSHAKRSYFIRFDDQTYARVNMEMVAGGDHFVVWESYYNPKPNSRNLEYDVTKPNPTP